MLRQFLNATGFFSKKHKNKVVLFYRNYQSFQGGHLKTWNYFEYFKKMNDFSPKIYFSKTSVWEQNPWKGRCEPEKVWNPNAADLLFLAGLDWSALNGFNLDKKKPIINLIQHVRHADPADIRYEYLKNKAIRICVSGEVASALKETNRVNGPIFTIPNGIDLELLPKSLFTENKHNTDVFISGLKNKKLAYELKDKLVELGIIVDYQVENLPRNIYLNKIANARISLLLPSITEGFYLPALESMACRSLTICPDCIGNRGFCSDGVNCYMPEYNLDALLSATLRALDLDAEHYQDIINNALQTASNHSLKKEEEKFSEIMSNIDQIW